MGEYKIIPFDVIELTNLTEIILDNIPEEGDPLEIEGQLYFVCEMNYKPQSDPLILGVIPAVVKNPSKVPDIKRYFDCLRLAHRKVLFRNDEGTCNLDDCDEMIIS